MEIPDSFKTKIAQTFYDKNIEVKEITETTDAEGGKKKTAGATTDSFKGNVQPISVQLMQSLLGQNIEADYKITAPDTAVVETGNLIVTSGMVYEVVDCKKYNSHTEMLVKRWQQP